MPAGSSSLVCCLRDSRCPSPLAGTTADWFSNWGAEEIIAVDLDGNREVVGRGPEGAGWAVNWLPDGRMLITGASCSGSSPTAPDSGMPT